MSRYISKDRLKFLEKLENDQRIRLFEAPAVIPWKIDLRTRFLETDPLFEEIPYRDFEEQDEKLHSSLFRTMLSKMRGTLMDPDELEIVIKLALERVVVANLKDAPEECEEVVVLLKGTENNADTICAELVTTTSDFLDYLGYKRVKRVIEYSVFLSSSDDDFVKMEDSSDYNEGDSHVSLYFSIGNLVVYAVIWLFLN